MVVMLPVNTVLFQRLLKNDVYRLCKNTYHNKCRNHQPLKSKPSINGVSSNNNTAKSGEDGHIGHYHNGLSNGVIGSGDHNDKKEI